MNWWKAHHGISTDRKYAVVLRHLQQSVRDRNALRNVTDTVGNDCHVTRASIVSIWVWLIDFSSQNTPRGSIDGVEIDEISVSLDIPDQTVSDVIEALRWKGMISGNVLTAFDKRQPDNDPTNAERQRRYRDHQKKIADRNALRNGHNGLPLARGDGDGDGDGERQVVSLNGKYSSKESNGKNGRTDNGPAQRSMDGNGSRPSQSPSVEDFTWMESTIYDYMRMAGTPHERKFKPPDADIVARCVDAVSGADHRSVNALLRDLFGTREQSPRHANGPRKYVWFEKVFIEAFHGAAQSK